MRTNLPARRAGHHADVVAQPLGAYEVRPVTAGLGDVAALLDERDRTMGLVARRLVGMRTDDGLPELLDGISLQVWLEHHGRLPAADARRLLAAVDVLAHMPRILDGLCDRWLSWAQTDAICAAARRVPVRRLHELDAMVATAMVGLADADPDGLVWRVQQWADELRPSRLERAEAAADRGEFLTLAPRLFGGGSLYGELGTVGFATIAEALDAPLGPPPVVPDDLDDEEAVDEAFATLDDQRRRLTRNHGAALAERLVGLCEDALARVPGALGDAAERDVARPRPMLLATVDAEALLDADRTPGWLLHTLAGGRMKVSTSLLQRLVEERGADLRTVVLDDVGQVVGVGRRTRVPPGWLREAIWARDMLVRDPDRRIPVRRADLDHVRPWPDGPTDVDNLHPLGRRWHNAKTDRRWTVTRARDGTATWQHRRHGWRITLAPTRGDLADPPDPGPPRLPFDALARAGPPAD